MSLVSEALKKAQREATARQGRDAGLPEPPPLQPFRARPRRRRGLLLGAGMGLAAALVLIGAYLARSGPRAPSPDARRSPAGEAGGAATAGAAAAARSSSPLAESPTPSQPPASRAVGPRTNEPPPPLEPSLAAEVPPLPRAPQTPRDALPVPTARPAPAAPAAARPDARAEAATATGILAPEAATAPPAARPAPAKDFVRRAELPDGTVLELGGIAYSASAPFAYLNGKLLAAGESVAGYRVESIARDRVVLVAGGERITLRLKAP